MNKVCRICLVTKRDLKSLKGNKELVEKLEIVSSVQFEWTNGMPTKVCDHCSYTVNSFYAFRTKIACNEQYLKKGYFNTSATDFNVRKRKTFSKYDLAIQKLYLDSTSDHIVQHLIEKSSKFKTPTIPKALCEVSPITNESLSIIDQGCDITVTTSIVSTEPIKTEIPEDAMNPSEFAIKVEELKIEDLIFGSDKLHGACKQEVDDENDFIKKQKLDEQLQNEQLHNEQLKNKQQQNEQLQDEQLQDELQDEQHPDKQQQQEQLPDRQLQDEQLPNNRLLDKKQFREQPLNEQHSNEQPSIYQMSCTKPKQGKLRHIHHCKKCDYKTDDPLAVQRHARTHPTQSICTFCGKIVPRHSLRHHLLHHSSPITCPTCKKVLKNKASYQAHEQYHIREIKICELCGKHCTTRGQFKSHRLKHKITSESYIKPHKCNHCDMAFTDKYGLSKHMYSHTGEQPYKCNYCCKKYSSKFNLNTHERQHSNQIS